MRWLRLNLAALGLLLFGCPPPPTPVEPGPELTKPPPVCLAPVDLRPHHVCDGLFTREGYACARCPAPGAGCVVSDVQVYCTGGPCVADSRCKTQR